jgi:PAS domain S-box-containing protein
MERKGETGKVVLNQAKNMILKNLIQSMRHSRGIGLQVVVAGVLILGALLSWRMVDQGNKKTVGGEAEKGPVLFLGNESLPPMNFMSHGKPTGIVIDLCKALEKRMQHRVQIRLMHWAEAQRLVLEGRADALLQMNPNPERLKLYDFSDPLLISEFTIFTSAERLGLTSLRDLHGLKVGVEKDGLPFFSLQKDPSIIVKIIPDFIQGFSMLAAGAVDAVVADRWVGSYVLAENNIRGVRLIKEPISQSHSAIAVKKGNTNLLRDINTALADIRRDGTYDRIIDSWRSKEVVFKTREQLRHQAWLITAITMALILALVGITTLVREIRRRNRAEEALRLSEEKFVLAFAGNPAAITMIRLEDGLFLEGNDTWMALIGYSRDEVIGRSAWNLPVWPTAATANRFVQELREKGSLRWLEQEFSKKSGEVFVAQLSAQILNIRGDKVILSTLEDITERKLAEEALRKSEERYRLLVEQAVDGIFVSDSMGHYLDVNTAGSQMLGYTRKEILKRTIADVIVKEEIQRIVPEVARFAGGQVVSSEWCFRRKDGSSFIGEVRGRQLPDGRLQAILRDITDRRRVEAELEKMRNMLSEGQRIAHLGTFEYIADTQTTVWSEEEYCIYGLDPSRPSPAYEVMLAKSIHPEDADLLHRTFTAAIQSGSLYELEHRIVRPDGSMRWVLDRAYPHFDPNGKLVRYVGVTLDITERKRAQEAFKKAHDELEIRVQERTAELSSTVARMEQLNRELEEFAFIASHDLQEPLRKIETFSDMAKKRCGPLMDKTSRDYLDRVIKSASRMRRLIGDLLKLSRITTKPKPFQGIDLFNIVKEVTEVFEPAFKETGGRIEIDQMPIIEADETQMRQLFQNLIGNALKFRDQNKPLIRVYGQVADHGFYEIFVKDNGIGFGPEYAERIFIPFERLHGRSEYEGTGMGLAICRKIVERHGGTIRAESEPEKGATFIVRLPLKQDGKPLSSQGMGKSSSTIVG